MAEKFNKSKYDMQFDKETYERITVKLHIGNKDIVNKLASDEGKSVNQYIKDLIGQDMISKYIDLPENW